MMKSKKKLAAGAMVFTLALGGGASAFAAVPQQSGNVIKPAVQQQNKGGAVQAANYVQAPSQSQWKNIQDKFPRLSQIGQQVPSFIPGFAQSTQNGQQSYPGFTQGQGQQGQQGQGQWQGQNGQQGYGQSPLALFATDDLAELLDLTTEELAEALMDGSTLADIAEDQDVDVDDVIDLITSTITDALDEQLDNGTIDEDQYDTALDEIDEFVSALVDGTLNDEDEDEDEDTDGTDYLSDFTEKTFYTNEDLADLYGITTTQLKHKINSGYTYEELADQYDVDVDDVVSVITDVITDNLDDQLDDEDITDDEYDAAIDALDDYVTDLVEGNL